jgi:putative nucleotidyltransferase with HDIG domain
VHDLLKEKKNFVRADLLIDEDFECYHGVPLVTKGQLKGVLEVFLRSHHTVDDEWLNFLEILAGQIAIAVDSASLFDSLQRSNTELFMAYDATIEGWSAALDLRDKETKGHSQRVTEMTVKLARSLCLGEADLVQVRWGALLHDIGKMGVQDAILLKPGPLTDEEWVLMKKHPTFAYEILSPIHYLKAALDIPYCHHEKWDGTGYPRGLKGEKIPLTARIFAVVDVWDALTSDRPYRKAWSEEKARQHIQAGAGTHFDPQVVKTFFLENV